MSTSYNSQNQSLNEQIAVDEESARSLLVEIIESSPLDTMEARLAALVAYWANAQGVVRKSRRDLLMTLESGVASRYTPKPTPYYGQTQADELEPDSTVIIPPVTDAPDSSPDSESSASFATPPGGFLNKES